ncbi:type I restriction enzyme S subunit [Stenotrophomonas sp. AG209]|uniref:restriction endonuclease subunit S n=1 Tax=Stenotrophomonas sp. AG209 TaxID=2183909 RepID=UPI000E5A243E|nr:restriction endonuclease subunit S [Stenotrophomonas sp. AG209]RIA34197.1 type I restriction enzyme S subunit [Stenotrophomonas sp. AG209]
MQAPILFSDLIVETKDGEWGEGQEAPGHVLCDVIRGTDFAGLNAPSIELPQRWIPEHLVARKALEADDILIETAGGTAKQSTGRTALVSKEFLASRGGRPVLCSSFARHLRVDRNKVHPVYLYYVLQALYASGYMGVFNLQHTGVARFQFTAFRTKTRLTLHESAAQPKIAAALKSYDDLIAINQRRIALLESMAEEIYREWFVRLRFPGYTVSSFDKGLPKGWSSTPLGQLIGETKRPVKKSDLAGHTRYVGLEHISRKSVALTMHGAPESVESDKLAFFAGDILFSKIRPYLHKVALAHFDGICSTDTLVLSPKRQDFREFALLTVFSETFIEIANTASKGTKMPRADWHFLKQLRVSVPSDPLLARFNTMVKPMLDEIASLIHLNETLAKQRDALLPRLISGKLRVDALDIQFPPSMQPPSEAA